MNKFKVYSDVEPSVPSQGIGVKTERKALGVLNKAPTENVQGTRNSFQKKHKKEKKSDVSSESFISVSQKLLQEAGDYAGFASKMIMCMKEREKQHLVKVTFLEKQKNITFHMRSTLIDWLVDVSNQFEAADEVIFSTVNYLDRMLNRVNTDRSKFQLLGLTCLSLAWKYEDVCSKPRLKDLIYFTDGGCNYEQVLEMEQLIVTVLEFNLTTATPLDFFNIFSSHVPLPDNAKLAAKHLLESCLLDCDTSIRFKPSLLASSLLFLARLENNLIPWPQEMVQLTGCSANSLESCVKDLYRLRRKLPFADFLSVDKKYGKLVNRQSLS